MSEDVQINPRLLAWARRTAGLSVEEAAEKLGLKDTAKKSGADKLRDIEAGASPLSEARLQKAAAVYRRPLIAFYLPEPPARGERGEDFRTVTADVTVRDNALLDALMRDVRARQQLVRELLIEEGGRPLSFVASARVAHGAHKVAAAIRNTLDILEEHQRAAKGPSDLFTLLRAATERAGIYVLLLGDLGSHHSDVGEDVFRGFALADDIAPFIVINDNDAVAARTFTLMHELAHIWIGASGVSGPLAALSENVIERFCNAVAGEFLLPVKGSALPDLRQADVATVQRAVIRLAETWNVSEGVVTYRFFSEGRIVGDVAGSLFRMFAERWRAEKTKRKEKDGESGPSYYVVRRHRLGNALLGVVRRAIQEETITHTRAAKILGVSPSSVDRLLQERIRAA
jgi:Zn-dependent peptidase ImmA (M78 family)